MASLRAGCVASVPASTCRRESWHSIDIRIKKIVEKVGNAEGSPRLAAVLSCSILNPVETHEKGYGMQTLTLAAADVAEHSHKQAGVIGREAHSAGESTDLFFG